jgi:transposase
VATANRGGRTRRAAAVSTGELGATGPRGPIPKGVPEFFRTSNAEQARQMVRYFAERKEKIGECEEEMEKYLGSLPHVTEEEPPELLLKEKRNLMSFNVRDHAYKMLGVDLFRIRGLNSETVLRIVSEVGVDLKAFPSEKHFASWLCLNPNRRVSGGKVLSSRRLHWLYGTALTSLVAAAALLGFPFEMVACFACGGGVLFWLNMRAGA